MQLKRAITDKATSVCVLTNKINHILRLWKYQFINITKMAQSESRNILKFDISVIKLNFKYPQIAIGRVCG